MQRLFIHRLSILILTYTFSLSLICSHHLEIPSWKSFTSKNIAGNIFSYFKNTAIGLWHFFLDPILLCFSITHWCSLDIHFNYVLRKMHGELGLAARCDTRRVRECLHNISARLYLRWIKFSKKKNDSSIEMSRGWMIKVCILAAFFFRRVGWPWHEHWNTFRLPIVQWAIRLRLTITYDSE